jgi:hypothetical protein
MALPANILKAALNNITKLFDNDLVVEILNSTDKFQPLELFKVLDKSELIERFNEAELEEDILLTIQRIFI